MALMNNSLLLCCSLIIFSLMVASASAYGDASYPEKKPTIYGFQGLIYCRQSYSLTPLMGGLAKIYCKKGSAKFTKLTPATDYNGYFLALIKPSELEYGLKPNDCKVVLHSSPFQNCKTPTDVSNGITGAVPQYSREVPDFQKKYDMKLYSVSPFVYV